MSEPLLIKKIEEVAKEFAEKTTAELSSSVPEFAKMTIHFRNGAQTIYSKIATKLTFPPVGVVMFADHSEEKVSLVLLNLRTTGSHFDIMRITLRDLPSEEMTDEIM